MNLIFFILSGSILCYQAGAFKFQLQLGRNSKSLFASDGRNSFTQQRQERRQPWEIGRFVRQSSKFVNLPFTPKPKKKIIRPDEILWETSSKNDFQFGPLDDVVMGGVSSSTFDDASGKWRGKVTDANNGGFIGIRSYPPFQYDMSSCKGIELRVRGSKGKRFKFILRDSTDFNGITWSTSVSIGKEQGEKNSIMKLFEDSSSKKENDEVKTIRVFFDEQIPALFARTVANQSFKKSSVTGIQITYSKFEYDGALNPLFTLGDTELQIISIKSF